MFRKLKNIKAFTFTEILVVLLIISVLAAIVLPSYKRAVEKARAVNAMKNLGEIAKAQMNYKARKGLYAEDIYSLSLSIKNENEQNVEAGTEFTDKYFNYIVQGKDNKKAIATRNTMEYEIFVDYRTGKFCCRNLNSSICSVFGLRQGDCSSDLDWEPCDGTLNKMMNNWTGVIYDNEINSKHCQIAFNDEGPNRIDFEICPDRNLAVYRFGLSTTGISAKCFRGYFSNENGKKIVYTYCDSLEQCSEEERSASVYYVYDDYHIVVHCPKYNFERETCVNASPTHQRIYKYINKHNPDLYEEESFAYCNQFDDNNICIDIQCMKGDCDFY